MSMLICIMSLNIITHLISGVGKQCNFCKVEKGKFVSIQTMKT